MNPKRKLTVNRAKDAEQAAIRRQISTHRKIDALHPSRVGAYLPSIDEENRLVERLSDICDSTKRRGAGDVKVGLPLLKPSGDAAFQEFHEFITPKPKEKKKEKTWEDIEREFVKPDAPSYKTIAMPRGWCIWCMKGGHDPKTMEWGTLPVGERIAACDMKPGDVFLYFICGPCKQAREEEYKSPIKVVVDGQLVPIGSIKSMEHYNTLRKNIVKVIKAGRIERAGDSEDGMRVQGIGGV